MVNAQSPFGRPLYVMAKPAGALCNLACTYCYYLEKDRLYPAEGARVMTDELLELFIRQYIEAQTMPYVLFTWHGGEPLMRPISFYRRALQLQQYYAQGRHIDNCLQTNGTLLNDEWCAFLKENHFLVGISIDGPQDCHDAYRRSSHGRPSWHDTMRGIRLLQKHGVQWNAMAVVSAANVGRPQEFYRFFRDIGCQYLQFTPVVERFVSSPSSSSHPRGRSARRFIVGPSSPSPPSEPQRQEISIAPFSVTPHQWGAFLCSVYDQWVRRDVGSIFVQIFDATLANWAGVPPGVCSLAPQCGHAAVIEFNGDVYSCDHFVFPQYRLGNIRQQTITAMMYSERQRDFGRAKSDSLPRQCRECRFLFACHGECLRNRFLCDRYGNPGLNYLCQGYQQFFHHVAADMDFMKAELDAGRPPANIMRQRYGEFPEDAMND